MIYNRSETQVRINTSGIPVCVTSLLSLPVIIKPHLSHVIYGELTNMLSVIKNSIYVPEIVFESSSFTGNGKIARLEDNRVRLGDKQKVGNAV